jgi:hypothetical protein
MAALRNLLLMCPRRQFDFGAGASVQKRLRNSSDTVA